MWIIGSGNVSRKYFGLVIIVIETVEELIVPHARALGMQHFDSKNLVVKYFMRNFIQQIFMNYLYCYFWH